jgi:hypothetical protein
MKNKPAVDTKGLSIKLEGSTLTVVERILELEKENKELKKELLAEIKLRQDTEKENMILFKQNITLYPRLIGEFIGTLDGICAFNEIPEELKEKLRLKIKELEGK